MFEMQKKLRWSALKAGLIISLALVVLFTAILYAGVIKQLFTPTTELRARFRDVRGLSRGAPVRLFGTDVGSVEKIQLDNLAGLIVTLSIDQKAEHFLRSDAEAEILTMGLLGETYVALTPGSPKAPPLQPDEILKGKAPLEYMKVVEESGKAIEKMTDFITQVEKLIAKIAEGRGTFSKLINDPALYDSMVKSTKALQTNLEELGKSRGTLKLLLEDPTLYHRLTATVSSWEEWSKTLNKSSGTLAKFIQDPALYDRTLAAVSDLEELAGRIKAGQGSLGKLMVDPELYDNLNKSTQKLEAILTSINQGQGLAGALVRDKKMAGQTKEAVQEISRLAEEMKNLLRDVQENPNKYFKFSIF